MAKRKGTTVSLVYVGVDPEHDAEFNDWYNQEHVPDMLKMPGYLNAGRYEALKGGPRYLAVYELESPEASETAELKAYHANLTERSKKMSPPASDATSSITSIPRSIPERVMLTSWDAGWSPLSR